MNAGPMNARLAFAACSITLLLAACGGRDAHDANASAQTPAQDDALPRPDPDGGAVTGMPAKPGPGPIGPPPTAELEGEEVLPPDAMAEAAPEQGGTLAALPPDAAQQASGAVQGELEPTPADAVAVVRDYYAALAGGDPARARAMWSDGSARDLVAQDAGTVALSVDVGAPGRVEAAAGSRYVRVPVNVTRTLADGGVQRSTGIVTLRRSVVDGATADQRAWRIASAELRTGP